MPANDYYDSTNVPAPKSAVTSATLRAEYNLIESAFNKLPPLTGNGGKVVIVNAGGTALTADTFASLASASLALKANIASPTFAGTVTIPTLQLDATVLTVTGTQLNFVAGASSNIQTQLTANANAVALKANTDNPSFTTRITTPAITLGATALTASGTELNYVTGVSSPIQTQIGNKANTASPTFTGNVTVPVLIGTDTTDAVSSTSAPFKTSGGFAAAKKGFFGTDLAVGGQLNLVGDLIKSRSESGADSLISISNTSNTANSGANFIATVAGASAGDPSITFNINGVAAATIGLDNSDSDKFKISLFTALGPNDALAITTAGVVEIPMGMMFTGPLTTPADGSIGKSSGSGLFLRGVTGSSFDFAVINAGGGTAIIGNTTGTLHVNMGGSFGRGTPIVKTANFSVGVSENWFINNKVGSTCTVTLPNAATYTGREIMITNYQFYTVVSATSNVVSQDGSTTSTAILPATQGKWVTLISDSSNWLIIQSN